MLIFSVPLCIFLHFCLPQDPFKRTNGMPLALMKPLIDAVQKLGRSLWYDVSGCSRACGVPAADIIKHLERIYPLLGMACPSAARVITLTDRAVPCQLANMESVLMICLVCLGQEASHFCVMHTVDTIHYSATPPSLSPGDTVFLPVEKHWLLPKLRASINFFAAIPFSNWQNAPFVPDDSCLISKYLPPSSVTWSDLQHGDTVQIYDGVSDASVLLHTQLSWRPTVHCPGLSRKGQFLFPGRWTVQLERGVTVLVLAVIPTNPASWDVVGVSAFCCTAGQADFRSILRFSESSVREIPPADKQGCEAGKTWMEGLYSGQCVSFQVPQRCQSCGPHQAKRELAYEDSRRSTRLPEITNLTTTTVKKESVTTNGVPKPNPTWNSTAKPQPKPKPKLKPKGKPKGHKKDSSPSKKLKNEETGSGTVNEEADLGKRLLAALQQTTQQQTKKSPEAQTRAR